MSDAPKRIWPDNSWFDYKTWERQIFPNTVEYIRADLHAALVAENELLREALSMIDVGEGWAALTARAALAAKGGA